eukprot:g15681.t1
MTTLEKLRSTMQAKTTQKNQRSCGRAQTEQLTPSDECNSDNITEVFSASRASAPSTKQPHWSFELTSAFAYSKLSALPLCLFPSNLSWPAQPLVQCIFQGKMEFLRFWLKCCPETCSCASRITILRLDFGFGADVDT